MTSEGKHLAYGLFPRSLSHLPENAQLKVAELGEDRQPLLLIYLQREALAFLAPPRTSPLAPSGPLGAQDSGLKDLSQLLVVQNLLLSYC